MKCKVTTLYELLHALAHHTGQSMERYGYGVMSEKIGDAITMKYLYELHLNVGKALENTTPTINLQPVKLDKVAKFLGYESYAVFAKAIEQPISPVLVNVIGNYTCYVRQNAQTTTILCSPVRIYKDEQKVWLELKGPSWTYKGEVLVKHGCLFVLMRTSEGKEFHHVYKIGQRERPDVLQGVFSGVSTAFDPIAGRVVLVRSDQEFGALENSQLTTAQLKKTNSTEAKALERYFRKFEDNNLSIKKVTTFTVADL